MSLALNLTALAALVPASLLAVRPGSSVGMRLWFAIAVAAVGACGWSIARLADHWDPGLGVALWISVAAILLAFSVIVLIRPWAGRLASLLGPYLLVMGAIAVLADRPEPVGVVGRLPEAWVIVHILVSLMTYALATLAAVAGLSVVLKGDALKAKRDSGWRAGLPAVADADRLQFQLLLLALIVLGIGIVSGMALEIAETSRLMAIDHKTVLSLVAFLVVAAVLGLHKWSGLRGRRAARVVLVVYLLLTLAYPGVKAIRGVMAG